MKSAPNAEKLITNGYDYINKNATLHEMYQVSPKEPFDILSSTPKYVYEEVIDKDINHNDMLATTTTSMPPKPPTTSSACSWWMLFLVNPCRQPKNDSDISSKEAISRISFQCNHTNVSSNIKHPSILSKRQVTTISVSNYHSTLTKSSLLQNNANPKINETTKVQEERSMKIDDNANVQAYEKYSKNNKSKANKKFVSSWLAYIYSNFTSWNMRRILRVTSNVLFLLIGVVLILFALKTWTRNKDWRSRETLFRYVQKSYQFYNSPMQA